MLKNIITNIVFLLSFTCIVACSRKSNEIVKEAKNQLPQNISLYPYDSTECNTVAKEISQIPSIKKSKVKYKSLGEYKICYTESEFSDFKMNYRLYLINEKGHKLVFSSQPGTGMCASNGIEVKYGLVKNEIATASSSHVIIIENIYEKACKGSFQDMISDSNIHVYDFAQEGNQVFTKKLVDQDGKFLRSNNLFGYQSSEFEHDGSKPDYKLELSGDKYLIKVIKEIGSPGET